jgi:LacI family transcriptional regulator
MDVHNQRNARHKSFYYYTIRMSKREGRATQARIAKDAGVSIGTVSAVLNQRTSGIYFSDATRIRVLSSAKRLGYRAHAAARQLRVGRSQVIGLVVDDLALPFLATVVQAIMAELREADYDCLLIDLGRDHTPGAAVERCRHVYQDGKVDAILLAGATRPLSDEDIRTLAGERIPVVLVERRMEGDSIPSVAVDNRAGGRIAVAHLIATGRRRIALISGPADNAMSADRVAGACEAASDAGVPIQPSRIVAGDWGLESGRKTMELLLPSSPDAVFAANDMMAIGAMSALADVGVRTPEDVAVIGYDDTPLAGFCRPPLSSVRQAPDIIGSAAVQLVLGTLGRSTAQPALAPLQPVLVVRKSTAGRRGK